MSRNANVTRPLKVAILGANGQVGAELCLLLARRTDVEIIPVCRNRSGSAYLRWMGLACRHGRPADAADGSRLLRDCDVVINSTLATGTPGEIRRAEDRIACHAFQYSAPGATVIHFSTQSVYGDPRAGRLMRWESPYGRAKLATERSVRRAQQRTGKPAYLFRLGHVCGPLQNISSDIQAEIRAGRVVLPERDCASNTVFTVTIVDAILKAISGGVAPGTYDLMNAPQWTWSQVYAYEAQSLGLPLVTRMVPAAQPPQLKQRLQRQALRALGALTGLPLVRQQGNRLMAHLPDAVNRRAQAWWYARRIRTEIASLPKLPPPAEHLSWVANGRAFIDGLTPTAELLRSLPYAGLMRPVHTSWPPDLPDAEPPQTPHERLNMERMVAETSS